MEQMLVAVLSIKFGVIIITVQIASFFSNEIQTGFSSPVQYIDIEYRLSIYDTFKKYRFLYSHFENIDIDKAILENIDIKIDIDKAILKISISISIGSL